VMVVGMMTKVTEISALCTGAEVLSPGERTT
jgi:hypothetical protein